jgi:hypothetical protein
MRRALTAFLILSLLGGQLGMFGALIGRHQAKEQMQHRVAAAPESPSTSADIEHLTISRSDLQAPNSSFVWIEEHEFRYQGNLYDIVSEEWRGSVWHVWVYHDREEEHYLEVLAQTINTPMLEGSTIPSQYRPPAYRPHALVPTALSFLPSPPVRWQSFPRSSFAAHQGPYLEVPHPPPWA